MNQKNLTDISGRIPLLTVEFVTRFSQIWEYIFKNGLRNRVPREFAYLGKLFTIAEMVNHVMAR